MEEEQEKCPSMDLGRAIKLDEENQKFSKVKIVLDCSVPVKEGTFKGKTKDGRNYTNNWHLWFGMVEDKNVYWKDEKREQLNYSGKILFFPNDNLSEQLIEACDGNNGVTVEISKVMKMGTKGKMLTPYVLTKLGGDVPSSNLSKDEKAFVDDLKNMGENEGVTINEETAINLAESDYGIKPERAREVYKLI